MLLNWFICVLGKFSCKKKFSSATYAVKMLNCTILNINKLVYLAYFNSLPYGIICWGNSSEKQKKIILHQRLLDLCQVPQDHAGDFSKNNLAFLLLHVSVYSVLNGICGK